MQLQLFRFKNQLISTILACLFLALLPGCNAGQTTPAVTTTVATTTSVIVPTPTSTWTANPPVPGEVEATEFLGTKLTPVSQQLNNALAGTQHLDKNNYVLTIDGMVDNPLKLTYDDLLALPQISKLMPLNCVEGWSFTAKWTGPSLKDLLDMAQIQEGAKIAIFKTADVPGGYSSLYLSYINDRTIILGMKINDITLPDERGFPFQVVAESKYGYKWSKWIAHIEISDNTDFRGYWEGYGYNNNADVGGPAFETGL